MVGTNESVFRFADVEVREREFRLIKSGEVVPVEPKAFRVLLLLLYNPQKLITKEELLNAVWGETAVSENSLTRSIALLRRLLGDDTHVPRYIETVATVGYRWMCRVEVADDNSRILEKAGETAADGEAAEAQEKLTEPNGDEGGRSRKTGKPRDPDQRKSARQLLFGCVVLVAGLAGAIWYLHRPLPPPRITAYTQLTHDGHEKWPAGTDGSRVYFTSFAPARISQVAVSGGEIADVTIAVPNMAFTKAHFAPEHSSLLEDVSPDGSSLLLASSEKGMVFDRPQWNVRVLGGSLRRLPDGASASFSPNGQTVAYATNAGDIWLVHSDGTGAYKLASVGGPANHLAWSPDGGALRFDLDGRIWEITSRGLNLHQVLRGSRLTDGLCCGRWTADGNFYLFQVGNPDLEATQIWAFDERRGLLRQPPAEPVQLTSGPTHWSWLVPGKDGKTIYAEGMTPRGELSRFDARSKRFLPFLGGISAGCVSFSNDGRFVAYVRYPEGTLWKANRDGSNPVQLTDPPISALNPSWSPDGTQIVFNDLSKYALELSTTIYMVPAVGGSAQKLFPGDKGETAIQAGRRTGAELRLAGPRPEAAILIQMRQRYASSISPAAR